MKIIELLRLIFQNIMQNKFKTVMTSIGIIVGTATIVMVIAIGRGGQMDVLEQFKNLNAGAIDISYEQDAAYSSFGSFSMNFSGLSNFGGGGRNFGGESSGGSMQMPGFGGSGSMQMPDFGGSGSMQMPDFGGDGEMQMPDFGEDGEMQMPDFGGDGEMQMPDFGGDGEMQMPDFGGDGEMQMPDFGGDGEMQMPDFGGDGEMQMPDFGEDGESVMPSEGEPENEEESMTEIAVAEEVEKSNKEKIILSDTEVEDIELFVPDISAVTISYSTKASVNGGELESASSYTVAGVKSNYAKISNLTMEVGSFIEDSDVDNKEKICVLGASAAKEIFGSAMEAYDSVLYISDRSYIVSGVLEAVGTVSSGISPDEAIFVPYTTGIKYITGENISPTITVLAENATTVDQTITNLTAVLEETYPTAEFTFTDAGSKMEAASQSNDILTILLYAMAAIVFVVGGIGIMNVLFVAVKERTEEIGILKAIGCSKKDILLEFLLEAAVISLIGGILGIGLSFAVEPVVTYFDVRVEMEPYAFVIALGFAVATGTIFGFYPAWKASRLLPVQALNQE